MLGLYENFPTTIHKIAYFTTHASNKKLQQKLTAILQKLNTETLTLEAVSDPSIPQGMVNFEFGIAEADTFNYLDSEETAKLLKTLSKQPMQTMDFFCAARYHKSRDERETHLRFDYYMLRFTFNEGTIEVRAFHERGPRYTSPEDVINLIANKMNEGSMKKLLKEIH
jgi:hypothetical protein